MGRSFALRLARLVLGLFLYATGIAVTLQAHIGYLPWDVFHSRATGISIGAATIAAGVVIIAAVLLLREKIGLGSLLNLVLLGLFLDLILWTDLVPLAGTFVWDLVILVVGLFLISLARNSTLGPASVPVPGTA
jgi:uncharacterized membrane protein YczE